MANNAAGSQTPTNADNASTVSGDTDTMGRPSNGGVTEEQFRMLCREVDALKVQVKTLSMSSINSSRSRSDIPVPNRPTARGRSQASDNDEASSVRTVSTGLVSARSGASYPASSMASECSPTLKSSGYAIRHRLVSYFVVGVCQGIVDSYNYIHDKNYPSVPKQTAGPCTWLVKNATLLLSPLVVNSLFVAFSTSHVHGPTVSLGTEG